MKHSGVHTHVMPAIQHIVLLRGRRNMTDLISREAVLELVDKGYLISNGNYEKVRKRIESIPTARVELSDEEMQLFKKLRSFHSGSYANLLDRIMAKASAQPEIIRCKDCKYFNPHVMECWGIGKWFGLEGEWGANDYCSKGERRADGAVTRSYIS